jgi:SLT domain-containing protein
MYDPVANIAAGSRYIQARYGTPANVPGIVALNSGGKYVGYDSGGILPPGVTNAVNQTGKPEAVLTNTQWDTLRQLAGDTGGAGGAGQAPVVNMNYYGPQEPTQEQKAIMMRELSMTLSGG